MKLSSPLYPEVLSLLTNTPPTKKPPPPVEGLKIRVRAKLPKVNQKEKDNYTHIATLTLKDAVEAVQIISPPTIKPSVHKSIKQLLLHDDSDDEVQIVNPPSVRKISKNVQDVIDLTGIDDTSPAVSVVGSVSTTEVNDDEVLNPTKRQKTTEEDSPLYNYGSLCNENSLFFSYNPLGFRKGEVLPDGHCTNCRCPTIFCANVVLGGSAKRHAEFLLYRNVKDPLKDKSDKGLKYVFAKCYTIAVNAKMRTNRIYVAAGFPIKK